MPLYDLFHRPLSEVHEWEGLHGQWCACITARLNAQLPKRFIASPGTHLGPFVSADVAERELLAHRNGAAAPDASGAVAVAEPEVYAPPAPDLTMPTAFPAEYLIEVRDLTRGSRVIAVVELVSPSNKKETDARHQFAAKCMSYLAKGIGLVVVDVVTDRRCNLHNDFVELAGHDERFLMDPSEWLYATAYRPVSRNDEDQIDLWRWALAVGAPLPTVPLALKGYGCVPLDLEATYLEACARNRIPE